MTESKKDIGSDLDKVDAYRNTAADYAEIPELDDAFFKAAIVQRNGQPVRGRPSFGDQPKRQITLRLDHDIIEHFRSRGPGWQGRINSALREKINQSLVDE